MYQTIRVSSCVSAQGELVEHLPNGDAIVRDGRQTYRGRLIAPMSAPARFAAAVVDSLRSVTMLPDEA